MATFRFRAQAAVDLRRTQDEEAQRALGDARRATAAAHLSLERAECTLAAAHRQACQAEAQASDTSRAIWYRNWMRRQQLVIAAARVVLEERRAAERVAAEHALGTRRRLRSLERLRERLWAAFQVAERRLEQKELDVLGGMRYVARRVVPEGA